MDKQKCLEILNQKIDEAQEETDRSPEGSSYGTLMLGRKQAFSDVRGLLKTLDEPEKPEIPAELAKKIENFKGKVTDDYIIYSIFLDDEYDNLNKDTHQWIKDNPGKLSRAVVNGYIIEKQPAWVVRINEKLYFCRFTDKYFEKDSDAPTYIESGNPSLIKKFTNKDKAKAEAVATLVDGEVEEWSE
ncbi:DUF1642 domain-containing protein [Tetragenococcus halophilus]|uniref:DUF1642 domain-containing protein n=1 Tax=Tetragenococcus halophilus TaxID=51669 RepID=A0AB35HMG8_TETHA|nr:DUF1642 domain-containing protein [Tetragenococcus halophilus]MCO8288290.1 DUF1642 domain-containing protein [Tetragenococcus halophilus]MCO8297242.1 DUF1642 domain-containing protein [Tetragenococcus halophilus]